MSDRDALRIAHEAIGGLLGESEFVVSWALTMDVVGPGESRYLAHRAGGGADGTDAPMVWSVLGMLRASVQAAEDQLRDCTDLADDDE